MRLDPLRDADVDALVEHLFRPMPLLAEDHVVYAVLDGARDRRIHTAVRDAGLPAVCLFSGALSPALAAAAPYLVQLRRASPFVRFILQNGWGNAWGIFAMSMATTEEMRRHLRRFLRVVDADGRRLFFRYYDPRVLRLYLPTCTEDELAAVFGPIQRFSLEAADRTRLIEHAVKHGRLTTAAVEVVGSGENRSDGSGVEPQ
jgi:hypothetical protein